MRARLAYRLSTEGGLWLPHAPQDDLPEATCDRTVRVQLRPDALEDFGEVAWSGRRGGFLRSYETDRGALICAGRSVRLLVDRTGESITVDCDPADEEACAVAAACASNLCLSIAALFRGDTPLHCAAAEVDGRLVGIMAPSGTGKSTLLWHLLDSGGRLMCDDVLFVRDQDGSLYGAPCLGLMSKLPEAAIRERGIDRSTGRRVLPDEDEWWVPVPRHLQVSGALPLCALFVLQPFTRPEPPGMGAAVALSGGEAVRVLNANTQGLWAVQRQVDGRALLGRYLALLSRTPVYALRYHRLPHVVPDLARTIRQLALGASAPSVPPSEPRPVARRRPRPAAAVAGATDA